jgi:hypothetical protein
MTFVVIGTLRPNYFEATIQEAYRARKIQHDKKKEQYVEFSQEMMQLISNSNIISKRKYVYVNMKF